MRHARGAAAGAAISLILVSSLAFGSDPPDSAVNPRSGYIETVDSFLSAGQYDVRHTITWGSGQVTQSFGSEAADDVGPRLVIGPEGDTWVVWWRDGVPRQVFVQKRTYSTGTWGPERQVGDPSESCSHPSIVLDGAQPWVAHEATDTSGRYIAVGAIQDDPVPMPGLRIATISYSGETDVKIDSESGHLWVTWIDSATDVGWCEYDHVTGIWSAPGYESYADDSVSAARIRIRSSVVE